LNGINFSVTRAAATLYFNVAIAPQSQPQTILETPSFLHRKPVQALQSQQCLTHVGHGLTKMLMPFGADLFFGFRCVMIERQIKAILEDAGEKKFGVRP